MTGGATFSALLDRMIATARAHVGLTDLGTGWEEGFTRLLADLDRLALPPDAAERTARKIGSLLEARLRAEQGWKAHPDCLHAPIVRPVIIAGLVRSGTTALHKLMAMDPQFQVPEYWLNFAPMPRPPRDQWIASPIYRQLAGYLDEQIGDAPELKTDHDQAIDDAEESIYILAQNFVHNLFASLWDLPGYDAWYRTQDETPNYRRLADVLRLIGKGDSRRWLLKNPTDLFSLDAVLNVFPDALVVQTHRDPVQAIPSVCGLLWGARRAMSGPDSDPRRIGPRESSFYAEALDRASTARMRAPEQFVDVEFREFVGDQLACVRMIYDRFGLGLTPEVEARMQRWLSANPRRSSSLQRRDPEEFGLTAAGLTRDYAHYRAARGYA